MTETQPPPHHNHHTEMACLGAMLLSAAIAAETLTIAPSSDYHNPQHATIAATIANHLHEHKPTEPTAIAITLHQLGQLKKLPGGANYLHDCIAACPTPGHGLYYARQIAEHARMRRLETDAYRLANATRIDNPQDREHHIAQILNELQPTGQPGHQPHPDWDQIWQSAAEEPDWLIPDMVETGQLAAIYAKPSAGKSLLAQDIAAALATGQPVLGCKPRDPLTVGYLDRENSHRDIVERMTAMGYTPDQLANLHYFTFPDIDPLNTPTGARRLLEWVTRYGIQTLIIDTISRFIDGVENDAEPWLALYRQTLAPLKALGVTVIRLDHPGKDETRGARGNSAKDGDVDMIWHLTRPTPTTRLLTREKTRTGRGHAVIQIQVRYEPLRHLIVEHPGSPTQQLLAALRTLGLPRDISHRKARAALTAAGYQMRNEALQQALQLYHDGHTPTENTDSSVTNTGFPGDDIRHVDEDTTPRMFPEICADAHNSGMDIATTDSNSRLPPVQHTTTPRDGNTPGTPPPPGNQVTAGQNPHEPFPDRSPNPGNIREHPTPVTLFPAAFPRSPLSGGERRTGRRLASGEGSKQPVTHTQCSACFGPLDDPDGTGRHPTCIPTPWLDALRRLHTEQTPPDATRDQIRQTLAAYGLRFRNDAFSEIVRLHRDGNQGAP